MVQSETSAVSSRGSSENANIQPSSSQVSAEEDSNASSSDIEWDSDLSPDNLKLSLEECLDNIKTAGSFATSGELSEPILSGLSVHNVGSIGLPLQEGQAKAIIGVCHRAPFGQGSRTIVDESVRKTWQLNPDQFELRNPKWPSVLRKVTERVALELGYVEAASVDAQLYKMLLYEKGAIFKPHKDTEKAPGMFGTLVICLPSEFEGGAVVASHHGNSKVFETASAFDHTYVAWYADVTHEVKAVTSGYRLVLTYNLIDLSQGLQRSADMLTREKKMLKRIISSWTSSVERPASKAPNFLAYKFDHEYTDASLKFQSLKGLDKVKAEYLREVCARAKASFFLASMKRIVMGSCEDGYGDYSRKWSQQRNRSQGMRVFEEVFEDSTELKRVIHLDGSVLAREVPIVEADIVQEKPFARGPDKENFTGFTGNEGATARHFYHATVAILVPFSSLARFLSKHVQQGIVDTNSWYERLIGTLQDEIGTEGCRQELYHLAVLISQTPPRPGAPQTVQERRSCSSRKEFFPAPDPQWPVEASILLKDQALFEMALRSLNSSSVALFGNMGKAMYLFDLPTTHTLINTFMSRIPTFHRQYSAFVSIVAGYEAMNSERSHRDNAKLRQIENWAEKTYMHRLQNVDTVGREDGLLLADLAINQAGLRPLSDIRAIYYFFCRVHYSTLIGLDLVNDAFDVFREVLTGFLPTFSVECRTETKRERSASDRLPSPVQCVMNADDIASLLIQLDSRDLDAEALQLTKKLESDASTVDVVAFESFYLPLLSALMASIPFSSEWAPHYCRLFRKTLLMYAKRFVQIEPQPGNWKFQPRGCGCHNCCQLDKFLVSASEQSMRFPVSSRERAHLHQTLEDTNISHVTKRGSVETLVVTKCPTPALAKYKQWQQRFEKAKEQIQKLDHGLLKQLLGGDYEYLSELKDTRRDREGLPSARRAERRQGPEIIDLT